MEEGWYYDGQDPTVERWWDGATWTSLTRPVLAAPEPPATVPTGPPTVPTGPPIGPPTGPPAAPSHPLFEVSPTHDQSVLGNLPPTIVNPAAVPAPTVIGVVPPAPPTVAAPAVGPPAGAPPPSSRGRTTVVVAVIIALAVIALGVMAGVLLGRSDSESDVATSDRSGVTTTAPSTTAPATSQPPATVGEAPPPLPTAPTTTAAPRQATTMATVAPAPNPGPTLQLAPVGWSASSTLVPQQLHCEPGVTMRYGIERAFDNDTQTAWAAARGRNVGESVTARFASGTEIREIALYNGYLRFARRKGADCEFQSSYYYNRYITRIAVRFDDGGEELIDLQPTESLQTIRLERPRVSSRVTIEIRDTVRPSGADDDTLISDIYFWGAQ